jgi:hypothetical protein
MTADKPKYYKKIKLGENVLRKVKRFKIPLKNGMLYAIMYVFVVFIIIFLLRY